MTFPILYSLQHCPYAIRARMALMLSKQSVYLRAVVMKNKPQEMLTASPKGSVPILVLDDAIVIDESLDIMIWALNKTDPADLLYKNLPEYYPNILALIHLNDEYFIHHLEKYKLASRCHDIAEIFYRQQCETFLQTLELLLHKNNYFFGSTPCIADYAIFPFIRQLARVDRKWYLDAPYPKLRNWLNIHLQTPIFTKVMAKYPLWLESHEQFLFAG